MTEEKFRKWGVAFKLMTLLGAIVLFIYGIFEYNRNNADESAKEFWKQQFPIYQELCKVAATIPLTSDSKVRANEEKRFWILFYGHARMVVDKEVQKKLSYYAYHLRMNKEHLTSDTELQYHAFELSTACRKSMANTWDIPLNMIKLEPIQ